MRSVVFTLFFTLIGPYLYAHPGIGLVYDGDNTIYYTDLEHVWRLNISNGEKEIAVQGVHTHELSMDRFGNLYGEHYWYDESEQVFKNRIWKLDRQGVHTYLNDERIGENIDFGFVRDREFGMYQFLPDNGSHSIIRTDSVGTTSLHRGGFTNPLWPYLGKENSLYFTDNDALYKLSSGSISRLAEGLISARVPFSVQDKKHSLFGIWTDSSNNAYVAVYRGRVVRRIDVTGRVTTPLKTSFLWSPLNGVFDKNGDLWLLQGSLLGKVSIEKVEGDTLRNDASFLVENLVLFLFLGGILIGFTVFWRRQNKKV